MQDLRCSDDSLTEVGHVTDDAGESRRSVSESDVDATSMTSRHVTSNSAAALRSPSRSLRDVTLTSSVSSPSASQKKKNFADRHDDGDDDDVRELEQMLSQVEASEREAWSWLD